MTTGVNTLAYNLYLGDVLRHTLIASHHFTLAAAIPTAAMPFY